jgi:hypothetical protein
MRAHYNRCKIRDIWTLKTPVELAVARRPKERCPKAGDEVEGLMQLLHDVHNVLNKADHTYLCLAEIPSLREYGIYLQKRARVLICLKDGCYSGVSSNEVISHLKNKHNVTCSPLVLENLDFVEDPPQDIYNQQEPIAPFQGIVMYEGMVCQLCFYACIKDEAMRKHMREIHGGSGV